MATLDVHASLYSAALFPGPKAKIYWGRHNCIWYRK